MDNASDKRSVCVSGLSISTDDQLDGEKFEDNDQKEEEIFDKTRGLISESIYESPILGRHFKLPDFSKSFDLNPPKLDSSLPYIPVYTHLKTHDLVPIERPKTPTFVRTLKSGRPMQTKNRVKLALTPRTHETDDQDEQKNDYSGLSTKLLKSKETPLQND